MIIRITALLAWLLLVLIVHCHLTDYTVKLWNVRHLQEATLITESLLASISTHSKSVNVVRWSKDGNYLASGSDDCLVLVHRFDPNGSAHQTFGSTKNSNNKENWSTCFTLKGHTMDVLDLDWTETGLLASASVDNTIIVWDVAKAVSNAAAGRASSLVLPARVLEHHESFVKGVSFDPCGQFLVSCGMDNSIAVWDCKQPDWPVVRDLRAALRDSVDTALFRRLAWSPDGQTFCASAAVKANCPVTVAFSRGKW